MCNNLPCISLSSPAWCYSLRCSFLNYWYIWKLLSIVLNAWIFLLYDSGHCYGWEIAGMRKALISEHISICKPAANRSGLCRPMLSGRLTKTAAYTSHTNIEGYKIYDNGLWMVPDPMSEDKTLGYGSNTRRVPASEGSNVRESTGSNLCKIFKKTFTSVLGGNIYGIIKVVLSLVDVVWFEFWILKSVPWEKVVVRILLDKIVFQMLYHTSCIWSGAEITFRNVYTFLQQASTTRDGIILVWSAWPFLSTVYGPLRGFSLGKLAKP